jgi:hypothetical protein
MNEQKKETVGALSVEMLQKEPETRDPIELEREIHKDTYEDNVYIAIESGKKQFTSPFYVVVLTKRERLMENVLRHYFFSRQSCPTPEWDQTVYRYRSEGEQIDFMWTVPDKNTCEMLRSNQVHVAPSEMWLMKLVMDFYDGTLDKQSRLLNGETKGSIVLPN